MVTIDTTLFITKAGKNQQRKCLERGGLKKYSLRRKGFTEGVDGWGPFKTPLSLYQVIRQGVDKEDHDNYCGRNWKIWSPTGKARGFLRRRIIIILPWIPWFRQPRSRFGLDRRAWR